MILQTMGECQPPTNNQKNSWRRETQVVVLWWMLSWLTQQRLSC